MPRPRYRPVDVVAEVEEHVPERERVLAPRDGDEDPVVGRHHPEAPDRLLDLGAEHREEMLGAEGRVVTPDLDHGGRPTAPALHRAPPEMTGRISSSSSSLTGVSRVISSPARMTAPCPPRRPSSLEDGAHRAPAFELAPRDRDCAAAPSPREASAGGYGCRNSVGSGFVPSLTETVRSWPSEPIDLHVDHVAGLQRVEDAPEVRRGLDRLPVHLHDHVSLPDPGIRGGAARERGEHEGSLLDGKTELEREIGRDVPRRDAEVCGRPGAGGRSPG